MFVYTLNEVSRGRGEGVRRHRIARFESAGDVRVMYVSEDEGSLVVGEDLSGPSAVVAYGGEERRLRMEFSVESVAQLLRVLDEMGEMPLRGYLSDEGHDIVDLMDLCDANGVPYTYVGLGPGGGVQFRPAP